jgi:hypothetical protein
MEYIGCDRSVAGNIHFSSPKVLPCIICLEQIRAKTFNGSCTTALTPHIVLGIYGIRNTEFPLMALFPSSFICCLIIGT